MIDMEKTLYKHTTTTALELILNKFRESAFTEREKGNYFEELALRYFQDDPSNKSIYKNVWHYESWAKEYGKELV